MLCGALLLLLLWAIRLAWLLHERRARPPTAPVRTLAVLGSGGHTAEMIQLLQALDRARFGPMLYVLADTDTTSANRIATFERDVAARRQPTGEGPPAYSLLRVRRSREVGQSYASSALTTSPPTRRRSPRTPLVSGSTTKVRSS